MLELTQPVAQIWSLPVALIHCIFILPIRRPLISSQSSQSVFPPTLSIPSVIELFLQTSIIRPLSNRAKLVAGVL